MSRSEAIVPEWGPRLANCGLSRISNLIDAKPGAGMGRGEWELLTKPGLGGRERWRWTLAESGAPVLYLKRYLHSPLRAQLDRILRQSATHSRAHWEFEIARRLSEAQVPTSRAVGYVEEMSGTLERRSAVLLERVEGDAFDRVWGRLVEADHALTRGLARQEMAVRLGRFVAAFHGSGLCHRDLYLCHIFVALEEQGVGPPRFSLIDLARIHRPVWRRTRWVLKDLSQLDASAQQIGATRADRLRFLIAYLGLLPDSPRVRWYAGRVAARSRRILRRVARKSAAR